MAHVRPLAAWSSMGLRLRRPVRFRHHPLWIPFVVFACGLAAASRAIAQVPPDDTHQDHAQHDMAMDADEASMGPSREASGTSWLPDDTPMYALHRQAGSWMLMAHGNAFLQYLQEWGDRGAHQVGSINWLMGMADRPLAGGHLGLRGMLSVEPATIAGCGYPDLLASGEVCRGDAIHDRQHPHDLFMELAATYDRPLAGDLRWQIYGGPAGEPALGPTAYPHRLSAMANPLAPITHHWLDATHITFGVATAGVYGADWKIEGSIFNGREPDEHRTDLDVGPLDSWSARVSYLPTSRWSLQVSAGRLQDAEASHEGEPRTDLDRVTASATYHRRVEDTTWATTLAWGRNGETGDTATSAWLAESSLLLRDRDVWFGRLEVSQKSGHDLALPSGDVVTVAKLQAGYSRVAVNWNGLAIGAGVGASAGIVPRSIEATYGRRVNPGIAIFLNVRPAETRMSH